MFGEDAGHAGERSFRDFFRLPPTKENRRQSVDSACRLLGKFVNARCQHVRHLYSTPPFFRCFGEDSEMETVVVPDDGLVILNGPRVKVRSYSERCQISWSNYGPVIVSEYAKTAFGSHPYRVVSITYDLNCSLSRHFQEVLGI